ncbi:MAG: metallophosphoesterase [Chloroflexia bacterium]
MSQTYVVGDVHGDYTRLVGLLKQARLVDERLRWLGGDSALWFMGDFFDRGEDGVAAVDLVMRLQREAAAAGGRVGALLGNHEPLILSALWMPDEQTSGLAGTFYGDWKLNGGTDSDLQRLTAAHTEWIVGLPSLAREGDWLLMHADSTDYIRYGRSIEEVNLALRALLLRRDPAEYNRLFGEFGREFGDHRPDGHRKVDLVLHTFGAARLVHGHTLISNMTRRPLQSVTEALVYDGGRCVDVDGGLGEGGQGFVYRLHSTPPTVSSAPREPLNLPTLDLGPWTEGLSLRREDMYGDDER